MEIGELHWRQRSGYRQPPTQNWYLPLRQAMQASRRGPGYSGGHFVQTRRLWNNYNNPPPVHGSGPPGYRSGSSGPPPPQGHSGGRFTPSRRFVAPTFIHSTSTYQQHRGNSTPNYGKYKGSSTNENKTSGNAFRSEPHWRNARNIGNGAKGFDAKKKYSVQNIELEEEEEGETGADAVGGNMSAARQESDTIYTNPQMSQDHEHYGNHQYDYTWHDHQPPEDKHWQGQYHQHDHDYFQYDHDPFLE